MSINSPENLKIFQRFINPKMQQAGSAPLNKQAFEPSKYVYSKQAQISEKDREMNQEILLPNDPLTKFKIELQNVVNLHDYATRGLAGDPKANFYEFLKLGNIPYFVGGAILLSMFMAGITSIDPKARLNAISKAKQIGVGIVFYYAACALAQKVIDIPVKLFRGIDLNHPYRHVEDRQVVNSEGMSPKKERIS